MADEELNFTEEEARIWANDPNNQPEDGRRFLAVFLGVCLLIVVLMYALVSAVGEPPAENDGIAVPPPVTLPAG